MWRRCALAWEAEHCAAEVRAAEEETGQEGGVGGGGGGVGEDASDTDFDCTQVFLTF